MEDTRPRGHRVQSVDRALMLMEALASEGRPMGLVELAQAVGLETTTVHRLLHTLIERGFVRQDSERGKYELGLKAFHVGNAVTYIAQLRKILRPYLERLVQDTGETSNLAVSDGWDGIYIEQIPGSQFLRMSTEVGRRVPLHSTAVGKALMAWLPQEEIEAFIKSNGLRRLTPNTIVEPAVFKAELERVRAQGYTLDLEEFELGANCIGAPVFGKRGSVVAAVSVSGPTVRFRSEDMERFKVYVCRCASAISKEMGYAFELPRLSSKGWEMVRP
ncbi:MAG: IclR family transcriptional regulator [Bacillota bacterium]